MCRTQWRYNRVHGVHNVVVVVRLSNRMSQRLCSVIRALFTMTNKKAHVGHAYCNYNRTHECAHFQYMLYLHVFSCTRAHVSPRMNERLWKPGVLEHISYAYAYNDSEHEGPGEGKLKH